MGKTFHNVELPKIAFRVRCFDLKISKCSFVGSTSDVYRKSLNILYKAIRNFVLSNQALSNPRTDFFAMSSIGRLLAGSNLSFVSLVCLVTDLYKLCTVMAVLSRINRTKSFLRSSHLPIFTYETADISVACVAKIPNSANKRNIFFIP